MKKIPEYSQEEIDRVTSVDPVLLFHSRCMARAKADPLFGANYGMAFYYACVAEASDYLVAKILDSRRKKI